MHFKTLEHIPLSDILAAFNRAFEEYELPLIFTEESFKQKLHNESIHLDRSVGAFDGEKLVGFILHGIDEWNGDKVAWDGGTGVISDYRGQQLTQRMYDFIVPLLKDMDTKRILLEVLQNNNSAKKIYTNLGFKDTRLLHAYKGVLENLPQSSYNVEVLDYYNPNELTNLRDWIPAWQQQNTAVRNCGNAILTIAISEKGGIVAYLHFNTITKRIYQFAVRKDYRRKGLATALFSYLAANNSEPVLAVNIDAGSENTNSFLRSIGLSLLISQYEMEKVL